VLELLLLASAGLFACLTRDCTILAFDARGCPFRKTFTCALALSEEPFALSLERGRSEAVAEAVESCLLEAGAGPDDPWPCGDEGSTKAGGDEGLSVLRPAVEAGELSPVAPAKTPEFCRFLTSARSTS